MADIGELSTFHRLAGLSRDELTVLARIGKGVSFPPGQRLFTEHAPADRCWLICDGLVQLDAQIPGRGEEVVQTLGRGDLLGWSWRVAPYRWHFGAKCIDAVTAIEFDARQLSELVDQDPRFGRALTTVLFETVLERLQATRARLLDLYRNPGKART
ncbi:cyclic nucleotide-binding domain-containing protein [Nocardia sp. NPDC049190]|uniref:Crp/Fnr family transcriptional regulator n=1 Tax=Nocardia sp. NPDC049190 TaxID=3155650 RepID=UPI0033F0BAE1